MKRSKRKLHPSAHTCVDQASCLCPLEVTLVPTYPCAVLPDCLEAMVLVSVSSDLETETC